LYEIVLLTSHKVQCKLLMEDSWQGECRTLDQRQHLINKMILLPTGFC